MKNTTTTNKSQHGFTLIELVVVIVILGILAAIAIPKYNSMRKDAIKAQVQGMAAATSSALQLNYAKSLMHPNNGVSDAALPSKDHWLKVPRAGKENNMTCADVKNDIRHILNGFYDKSLANSDLKNTGGFLYVTNSDPINCSKAGATFQCPLHFAGEDGAQTITFDNEIKFTGICTSGKTTK